MQIKSKYLIILFVIIIIVLLIFYYRHLLINKQVILEIENEFYEVENYKIIMNEKLLHTGSLSPKDKIKLVLKQFDTLNIIFSDKTEKKILVYVNNIHHKLTSINLTISSDGNIIPICDGFGYCKATQL